MKKFVICFLFLLTGCFGATRNSEFYLLEAQQGQKVLSDKKDVIAIENITLPDYLRKSQIILQSQDSPQIIISEFHRWGSELQSMIQNTLTEDFQYLMPQAIIRPLAYGQKNLYTIKISIEKFSGYFNEMTILKGEYQIIDSAGKVKAQKNFLLTAPSGKSYVSYVRAQSKLLSDLAENIALAL